MTSLAYTPAPFRGAQLQALFDRLLQTGLSPHAARALLTDLLEADDAIVTPRLPRRWRIVLLRNSKIAIQTARKIIAGTEVFVRQRPAKHPGGRPPEKNWIGARLALMIHIANDLHGTLPKAQQRLVDFALEWFEKNDPSAPAETKIREKLTRPLYRRKAK
jgi:hypothetical protein